MLELKSLADVALIGFPSAGKSSLVSVLSAARPKIADYPFTTLVPNLGVVTAGSSASPIADVPGLIPGASEGKGLGLEFLRHVERCSVLVHVVDCATLEPGRDPMTDLDVIEDELAAYVPDARLGGRPLSERTRIVVLNKADVPEARELAEMVRPDLEARGLEVHIVSAVAHTGLRELTFALARHVAAARAELEAEVTARRASCIRPGRRRRRRLPSSRENTPDGEVFRVARRAPDAAGCDQTDFSNDEAVGYLADRLSRLGVEEALLKAGAVAGATVLIGPEDNAVVFDWEPTLSAGAELLGGPRGTDLRLEAEARPQDPRRARGRTPRPQDARDRGPRPSWRRSDAPGTGRPRPTRTEPDDGHRAAPAAHRGRGRTALVVKVGSSSLTDRRRWRTSTPAALGALVDVARGAPRWPGTRSCSSPRAPSRPASARWGWPRRPVRPRHPAGGGQRGAGRARRGLPGGLLGARAHRRAGAAHRRRRHPAHALHQRPAHPGAAARARHRADRQRERHRGHPRDPVRRQRPARGAGRAPRARPTGWCCSPTSTRSTTGRPRAGGSRRVPLVGDDRGPRRRDDRRHRLGGRQRRHGDQGGGGRHRGCGRHPDAADPAART